MNHNKLLNATIIICILLASYACHKNLQSFSIENSSIIQNSKTQEKKICKHYEKMRTQIIEEDYIKRVDKNRQNISDRYAEYMTQYDDCIQYKKALKRLGLIR